MTDRIAFHLRKAARRARLRTNLETAGCLNHEFGFVVHGSVDPNERTLEACYLRDPQIVNMSPVGLRQFCMLRNWLPQCSHDFASAQ